MSNIKMKLKLYQRQGMSLEDAQAKVIDEASKIIQTQDELLAQCIEKMSRDDVISIFGSEDLPG